jgi:hypothetical protein
MNNLSLIDIEGLDQAISEMARVLRPGGALLIANLASFFTAGPPSGWIKEADGEPRFSSTIISKSAWNGRVGPACGCRTGIGRWAAICRFCSRRAFN